MPMRPKSHKQPKTVKLHDPRPNAGRRGYDRKWQKARAAYLAENPLCEQCLKEEKVTPTYDVDHIIPLSMGGERLDPENFQSLCRTHHNRKTHGRGKGGA